MRKLFDTGSSVTIEEFRSVRINGPYALLKLGPDFAVVKCGNYRIEAAGEELTVETLSEEVAVFTFSTIIALEIRNDGALPNA